MLISLNWVKEFVNLPNIDADELANSFTMTTAEVEGIETTNNHLRVIRVAEITAIEKHPEADKLNLVTFNTGEGGKTSAQVVCGAKNIKVGLKVPHCPLGATLPSGLTLEPKKIRGILSEGMLCSTDELGIGEGASGLMELPEDSVVGMPMLEFLEMDSDTVMDVDNKSLTHRPDLWGHYGIAREFAAAYELPLARPYDLKWQESIESNFSSDSSPIKPIVDADTSCRAYWGLSVDGISLGQTPGWMKNKLEAAGIRSISSIVDISNYVMLELGMPLHIFDRDTIANSTIHIKKMGTEGVFTTLDEVERSLLASDTMICDSEKPLVLGGIMGGLNSGVTESTTKIFIEVANWTADNVRKTSTRLGLRTDSSQRYEKSLDSKQCYQTLLRTLDLVTKVCPDAKVIGKPEYAGDDLSLIETTIIKTSRDSIAKTLGYDIAEEKLISIFESLDFKTSKNGSELTVELPSFRTTKDIEYEACLIEEVGRIIGYDNIIPVAPTTDIKATRFEPSKAFHRKVQDILSLNGSSLEVMTYPMIGAKLLEKAKWHEMNEELVLVNALSQDADRMRPSLVPHGLNTAAINSKNFNSFSFFELGRSYLADKKNFSNERSQLLIGMYNKAETPFVELINKVERLLSGLGISYDLMTDSGKFSNNVVPKDWFGVHPHEYVNIRIQGKFNGAVVSAHPLMLKNFKIKGYFSFAVIDYTDFHNREIKAKNKYTAISKFPTSKFDCTVLVGADKPAASVLTVFKKLKIKELGDVKITDVFPMGESNAVTLTMKFEDSTQTLKREVVKNAEKLVLEGLSSSGFPLKE